MEMVEVHTAETQLPRLVDAAAAGQEVVIARAGRPMAKLVPFAGPVTGTRRVLGALAGRLRVPVDFDASLPDAVLDGFEEHWGAEAPPARHRRTAPDPDQA